MFSKCRGVSHALITRHYDGNTPPFRWAWLTEFDIVSGEHEKTQRVSVAYSS